ncbi:MAG: hypothetical protein E6J38_02375 [Chloroflexi bacterium]|nr:MAG: hypothetical protein E6J38_02375 [Chloroflexota bacterium]
MTRREGVDLRAKLLATTPSDVNIKPSQQLPHVWAALLDVGTATGSATVAVVADGTVSMYTNTGGGMIGAGQHQVIHMPAARFLKCAFSARRLPLRAHGSRARISSPRYASCRHRWRRSPPVRLNVAASASTSGR